MKMADIKYYYILEFYSINKTLKSQDSSSTKLKIYSSDYNI